MNLYNRIPVIYCKHCKSLNIRVYSGAIDYCADCGSTVMSSTDIESWVRISGDKYKCLRYYGERKEDEGAE